MTREEEEDGRDDREKWWVEGRYDEERMKEVKKEKKKQWVQSQYLEEVYQDGEHSSVQ